MAAPSRLTGVVMDGPRPGSPAVAMHRMHTRLVVLAFVLVALGLVVLWLAAAG